MFLEKEVNALAFNRICAAI